MKKVVCLICILLLSICNTAFALDIDEEVEAENIVAHTVKYYKTVTNIGIGELNSGYNINNLPGVNNSSVTYEITEEEYESGNSDNIVLGYVETTYKRMDTYILENDGIYKYKVTLHWKNMPVVRSYDIIGIGFPASVQGHSPYTEYKYCYGGNACYTSTSGSNIYSGTNGVGVIIPLIDSTNITAMDLMLQFNITKNTTATLNRLYAYGDYAHAVRTVTLNNAKKYVVNSGGIQHDSTMVSSYDDIPTADTTCQVTW